VLVVPVEFESLPAARDHDARRVLWVAGRVEALDEFASSKGRQGTFFGLAMGDDALCGFPRQAAFGQKIKDRIG